MNKKIKVLIICDEGIGLQQLKTVLAKYKSEVQSISVNVGNRIFSESGAPTEMIQGTPQVVFVRCLILSNRIKKIRDCYKDIMVVYFGCPPCSMVGNERENLSDDFLPVTLNKRPDAVENLLTENFKQYL